MMILVPHENPQVSVDLPNPEFGDGLGLNVQLNVKTAMDGTVRTYVKRDSASRIQLAWRLDRLKAEELYELVRYMSGEHWRLYLHDDTVWKVKLITDPITLPFALPSNATTVTLDFEGEKLG